MDREPLEDGSGHFFFSEEDDFVQFGFSLKEFFVVFSVVDSDSECWEQLVAELGQSFWGSFTLESVFTRFHWLLSVGIVFSRRWLVEHHLR